MTTDRKIAAFTLIELLVVITVIALLAALIVTAGASALVKSKLNRARTELSTIQTSLESYKAQRGTYPPDNATNPAVPQLFYELTGTLLNSGTYNRIHGGETIPQAAVPYDFGVGGFVNSSEVANVNDPTQRQQAEARDFFPTIQPNEYYFYPTNPPGYSSNIVALLGVNIPGPIQLSAVQMVTTTNYITGSAAFSPFRYVSSSPTNNHDSYDLWVELTLRGKVYRISNWNPEPEVVQ